MTQAAIFDAGAAIGSPADADGPVLNFALVNGGKEYNLSLAPGQEVHVGRGGRCTVVLDSSSVSSSHVALSVCAAALGDKVGGTASGLTLRALDKSQNGTGIIDRVPNDGTEGPLRLLSKTTPEELADGSALVVPLRRKGMQGTICADQDNMFKVKIISGGAPSAGSTGLPTSGLPTSIPASTAANPQVVPQAAPAPVAAVAAASSPVKSPAKPGKTSVSGSPKVGQQLPTADLPDVYDPVTGAGRWRYESKLGEGGLAIVYRAVDCKGTLGEVAVKVLKHHERVNWGKQYAFAMHRESQWSLKRLHNASDPRFSEEASRLFSRYLEDHTGYAHLEPADFDAKRHKYEVPDFDWERDGPPLPSQPYVVMELVRGEGLNLLMDREKRQVLRGKSELAAHERFLTAAEKRDVLTQAAQALEYLDSFGLIHRDFRGCNMHLAEPGFGRPVLKVLDLGVMIDASDGQMWNTNQAVQAFKRRGETEEKKRRYDWLPWEVRAGADGQAPAVNFAPPVYSFDIFSLGILILHLLLGRSEARQALETVRLGGKMPDTKAVGIGLEMVQAMFAYESSKRPRPEDVVAAFQGKPLPSAVAAEEAKQQSRSRSRSRSRRRGGLRRVASCTSQPTVLPSTSCVSQRTGSRSRSRSRSRQRPPPAGSEQVDVDEESEEEGAFQDYRGKQDKGAAGGEAAQPNAAAASLALPPSNGSAHVLNRAHSDDVIQEPRRTLRKQSSASPHLLSPPASQKPPSPQFLQHSPEAPPSQSPQRAPLTSAPSPPPQQQGQGQPQEASGALAPVSAIATAPFLEAFSFAKAGASPTAASPPPPQGDIAVHILPTMADADLQEVEALLASIRSRAVPCEGVDLTAGDEDPELSEYWVIEYELSCPDAQPNSALY